MSELYHCNCQTCRPVILYHVSLTHYCAGRLTNIFWQINSAVNCNVSLGKNGLHICNLGRQHEILLLVRERQHRIDALRYGTDAVATF
jgi:hypothetical protein